MAIRSSHVPWMGQSFTIQTWPSRSMICALISPTFSYIRSRQSFLPLMIASRASLTHPGHSESVCRGQPSVGLDFLPRLQQRLIRPLRSEIRIRIVLVKKLNCVEGYPSGATGYVVDHLPGLRAHANFPRHVVFPHFPIVKSDMNAIRCPSSRNPLSCQSVLKEDFVPPTPGCQSGVPAISCTKCTKL